MGVAPAWDNCHRNIPSMALSLGSLWKAHSIQTLCFLEGLQLEEVEARRGCGQASPGTLTSAGPLSVPRPSSLYFSLSSLVDWPPGVALIARLNLRNSPWGVWPKKDVAGFFLQCGAKFSPQMSGTWSPLGDPYCPCSFLGIDKDSGKLLVLFRWQEAGVIRAQTSKPG